VEAWSGRRGEGHTGDDVELVVRVITEAAQRAVRDQGAGVQLSAGDLHVAQARGQSRHNALP